MGISAVLEKLPEDLEGDDEGTMHFMVNVVQPQFNLDSEEANVWTFSVSFRLSFLLLRRRKQVHLALISHCC